MLDDIALGGVDRLERTVGKAAALRALMGLRDSMRPGARRARVTLRGIVLASEAADVLALERLTLEWSAEPGAVHGDARRTARELLEGGHVSALEKLAEGELQRCLGGHDEAGAHYLVGRAAEARGAYRVAVQAYDHAVATGAGQPRLVLAAHVRAVRAALSATDTADAARRAASLLPLDDAPAEDRLAVAVAALACEGQYRRAAALDVLAQLAARGPASVRRTAMAKVAAHVERAAEALTPIERDRAAAVLAHAEPAARDAALARLEALGRLADRAPEGLASASAADPVSRQSARRVGALLEGAAPGPRPPGAGRELSGWLALEVVHAVRGGHRKDALDALRELEAVARGGARVEASLWTAAEVGLRVHPRPARALLAALLDGEGEPPPRGFSALANALEAIGAVDDAVRMLERATARREPKARLRLADHLRAAGWEAARDGRREEALRLLREARSLYKT